MAETQTEKKPLTYTQQILLILATKGCRNLEELSKETGLEVDELLVYLSRLHKRGLIIRKWRHYGGKRIREYCLKSEYKP